MDLDIDHLSVSASANTFPFGANALPEGDDNPNSSIASLMQISEKMDSLLPTEGTYAPPVPVFGPASNFILPEYSASSCTAEARLSNAVLPPYAPPVSVPESINYSLMYVQPHYHQSNYVAPSYLSKPLSPLSVITVPDHPSRRPPPLCTERCTSVIQEASSCSASCKQKVGPPGVNTVAALTTSSTTYASPPVLSPVSVKDISSLLGVSATQCSPPPLQAQPPVHPLPQQPVPERPRSKRKPKTYSKPVASRFCHICSRTPRRGHSAAVCAKISEGLCRKIVCEQCFREQGWDFAAAQRNPGQWRCPHCTDTCPRRSQCHIYNRINARRKRSASAFDGLLASPSPAPKRTKKSGSSKAKSRSKVVKPITTVKVERVLAMESSATVSATP